MLSVMLIAIVQAVLAQVTTSALSGKVTLGGSNESVVGATIQAIHEPSGTRYGAVTNVDGRYTIQGMRVGGPYTIKVTYIGYQPKEAKGVTLQLGETHNQNFNMSEDASVLGEVVIRGKASKFAAEKTGASTNISNTQIMNMPTINRSITDIARLSPYSNGMSFAGGDGRSTNFTLDGANLNNNFGLTSKLPGGGSPISMDAIDEVQVVVSPFDVRQTNFIGGGINAVTKSGTNTFKGSAYIYYNNENMHGNRVDDADLGERGKNRTTTYGFTLGGPIVKDKLFFFANAEYTTVPGVANRWAPSEDGRANIDQYSHALRRATSTALLSSLRRSTATTQVLTPTGAPTSTTSSCSAASTGTSPTTTILPCASTTLPTRCGTRLTATRQTRATVCATWTVSHSTPCRSQTPCTPWTTT